MKAKLASSMMLLLPVTTAAQQGVAVDPYGLGFRVAWRGGPNHSAGDQEKMTLAISEIKEMDADGAAVGVAGHSLSHHYVASADNNQNVSSGEDALVYIEGNSAIKESVYTVMLGGSASATFTAYKYLAAGNTTAVDSSIDTEKTNGTLRLDLQVNDWPFCTPFGWFGGVPCKAEAQDILLALPGALPEPPTPPPPHTLLVPRCHEDNVATLRFVCDPRTSECTNLASIKFYLGEARQSVHRAPNLATVTSNNTDGAEALEAAEEAGWYEYNVTRAELRGFLNVSDLTPGLEYVFWTVWGQENGSSPEFNTREFDLNRTQYWQCPGTTIPRNFEVGNALSVSFTLKGSSANMTPVCGEYPTTAQPPTAKTAKTNGEVLSSDSARNVRNWRRRLSRPEGRNQIVSGSRHLLSGKTNDSLCSNYDNNRKHEREKVEWAWGGGGGAMFAVGDRSRVWFSSGAWLDGSWSPLQEGTSTANSEGQVVAVIDKFRSGAVYSMLFLLADEPEVRDSSTLEHDDKTAMWVVIAFITSFLWLLGCCTLHQKNDSRATRTWSVAIARAQARARGYLDSDKDGDTIVSNLSNPGTTHPDMRESVKELQRFPMTVTPDVPRASSFDPSPLSPFHFSDIAPFAEWTSPGSVTRESSPAAPMPARVVGTGIGVGAPSLPPDAFPCISPEVGSGVDVGEMKERGTRRSEVESPVPVTMVVQSTAMETQENRVGYMVGVEGVQVVEV